MNFKKCNHCGCFFSSMDNICSNCSTKEKISLSINTNFIGENSINNINIINESLNNSVINENTSNKFIENNFTF